MLSEVIDAGRGVDARSQPAAENPAPDHARFLRAGAGAGTDDVVPAKLFRQTLGALSTGRFASRARVASGRAGDLCRVRLELEPLPLLNCQPHRGRGEGARAGTERRGRSGAGRLAYVTD